MKLSGTVHVIGITLVSAFIGVLNSTSGFAKTPCFKPAWGALTSEQRLQICTNLAPAKVQECLDSPSEYINRVAKKEVCGMATSHSMDCLNAHAPLLSSEDKVQLCAHTFSTAPVECFRMAPEVLDKGQKLRLCKGSYISSAGHCFNVAPAELSLEQKITLCQRAVSTGPAVCYKTAPTALSTPLKIELCREAANFDLVGCFNSAPKELDAETKIRLCREKFDI